MVFIKALITNNHFSDKVYSVKQFHSKAYLVIVTLIAFSFPFVKATPLLIVLLAINWLIEGNFANKLKLLSINKVVLLFISFYLLHIISALYSDNLKVGLFDLQVKLSLLVFPIIVASSAPLTLKKTHNVYKALIGGLIISTIIMLVRAYIFYGESNLTHHFFYHYLSSVFIHPSYLSMYINLSICFLLYHYTNNTSSLTIRGKIIGAIIVLYLSFIVVLLSSRVGIAVLVLALTVFIIYQLFAKRRLLIGVLCIAFLCISIILTNMFLDQVSNRVVELNSTLKNKTQSTNVNTQKSSAVRLLIWECAYNLFQEQPIFGYGNGDVNDKLNSKYEERGITLARSLSLNAHNQYLQTLLGTGMLGLILLGLILAIPFALSIKYKNYLYTMFVIIVSINFLPESMLETQAGTMFFGYFNSVLFFHNQTKS